MLPLFICAFILCASNDVYGKYQRASQGWLAEHKVAATWDAGYQQCILEGAVLASPITQDLRSDMLALMGFNSTKYFLGTSARFVKNIFTSVEGIPVDNMPVLDMIDKLNPDDGQCLAMDSEGISVVPCSSHLPYMCYKKLTNNLVVSECGTFDTGYKYVKSTGSCYKTHFNLTLWGDAYSTCIAEGGYLVIVNDISEAQMLIKDIVTVKTHYILIGLEDWKGTDEWTSLHGHPIDEIYNDWVSDDKPSTTTRCGTIDPDTAELKAFGDCLNTKFYFVCEKDPAAIKFPVLDDRMGD